jgi:transcriptional regulator with XRE-family HTH domain
LFLQKKRKTGKWLAEQVNRDPATVSKWCTNSAQPDLQMLTQIAFLLDVEVKDLINKNKHILNV